MIGIQRGKYLGKCLGDPPKDEAEHFVRCPACGKVSSEIWPAGRTTDQPDVP